MRRSCFYLLQSIFVRFQTPATTDLCYSSLLTLFLAQFFAVRAVISDQMSRHCAATVDKRSLGIDKPLGSPNEASRSECGGTESTSSQRRKMTTCIKTSARSLADSIRRERKGSHLPGKINCCLYLK